MVVFCRMGWLLPIFFLSGMVFQNYHSEVLVWWFCLHRLVCGCIICWLSLHVLQVIFFFLLLPVREYSTPPISIFPLFQELEGGVIFKFNWNICVHSHLQHQGRIKRQHCQKQFLIILGDSGCAATVTIHVICLFHHYSVRLSVSEIVLDGGY